MYLGSQGPNKDFFVEWCTNYGELYNFNNEPTFISKKKKDKTFDITEQESIKYL